MRNLTCIVCPIGCSLDIEEVSADNLSITGNKCPRGIAYAQEEIRSPKRVVTATCQLETEADAVSSAVRRVPVKTVAPCPKEKIPLLLKDIYKIKVTSPVKMGDVLIADWNGEGVDVVATRNLD